MGRRRRSPRRSPQGSPPGEILVLARTGYATEPLQHALAHAGIPHRVLGSLGLYERTEVRDALAYLTLLANPADAQAFRRAIGSPRRGVGTGNRQPAGHARARAHGGDLIAGERARAASSRASAEPAARERLDEFGEGLDARPRASSQPGRSLGSRVDRGGDAARRTRPPLRAPARPLTQPRARAGRRAGARGPALAVPRRPGVRGATRGRHAHRVPRARRRPARPGDRRPASDRRITVSTIHRAKGTEARLVVLLGCEEQLLPSWRSLSSPDPERLAEERRLFYVAATRAKDRLIITHAAERGGRPTGGPSRFLHEAGLTRRRASSLAA